VGIVGRLVPIKNHTMFLDAARDILNKNTGIDVKFLIIGDGELKEPLKRYARNLVLENNVIFTGWIKDLAPVYADLDIVALTSLNEGTPVSLIEAMASAKPVIATSVGGVKDLVTENKNGLLVCVNDVRDFSNKLAWLMCAKDARRSLGICGRESVRDRYSKERLVRDIEALYKECLKQKSREMI